MSKIHMEERSRLKKHIGKHQTKYKIGAGLAAMGGLAALRLKQMEIHRRQDKKKRDPRGNRKKLAKELLVGSPAIAQMSALDRLIELARGRGPWKGRQPDFSKVKDKGWKDLPGAMEKGTGKSYYPQTDPKGASEQAIRDMQVPRYEQDLVTGKRTKVRDAGPPKGAKSAKGIKSLKKGMSGKKKALIAAAIAVKAGLVGATIHHRRKKEKESYTYSALGEILEFGSGGAKHLARRLKAGSKTRGFGKGVPGVPNPRKIWGTSSITKRRYIQPSINYRKEVGMTRKRLRKEGMRARRGEIHEAIRDELDNDPIINRNQIPKRRRNFGAIVSGKSHSAMPRRPDSPLSKRVDLIIARRGLPKRSAYAQRRQGVN